MEELRFRFMKEEDIPQIVELEKICFTLPWSEQAFRNELTQNHFARYLVLEHGNEIVGYGGMWLIVDEAHVTNVAIHPAYRGRKLGELLMKQLMELAKAFKAKSMTLEVRASNYVAQSLYRKLGFTAAGVRPGYYSDNHEDALIMWVDL